MTKPIVAEPSDSRPTPSTSNVCLTAGLQTLNESSVIVIAAPAPAPLAAAQDWRAGV